jgi:hypothetical protein
MSNDTGFRAGIKQVLCTAVNGIQIDCLPDITHEGEYEAERFVEFNAPSTNSGGLISFELRDGILRLQIYRCDPEVKIIVGNFEHKRAWERESEQGMIGMEAKCDRCGEMYNPRSERRVNGDAPHDVTRSEQECGGTGEVICWWDAPCLACSHP